MNILKLISKIKVITAYFLPQYTLYITQQQKKLQDLCLVVDYVKVESMRIFNAYRKHIFHGKIVERIIDINDGVLYYACMTLKRFG